MQAARRMGAEVTGTAGSDEKAELARAAGAHQVIVYTREDLVAEVRRLTSGPIAPLDPQVLNGRGSLFLTRPTLAHYAATREELPWRTGDLFGWMARGELSVRVGVEYPLAEVGAAHVALEGQRTTGRVRLTVAPPG